MGQAQMRLHHHGSVISILGIILKHLGLSLGIGSFISSG
jgi:hypothetical protein